MKYWYDTGLQWPEYQKIITLAFCDPKFKGSTITYFEAEHTIILPQKNISKILN